ncbi:helix-turn-helix transcriptional regulator [bacterium]|nr:helix-turn-helix transcriptional regulator [bacterium]
MQITSTKDIGNLVKETRKKQKLTQVQLAQLSNVGTRFLSDLESGKPTCEIEKTIKILSNLGVKLIAQE